MKKSNADETVTVRVPKGTADKVRAATGQPFSRVVRWMVMQVLEKHAAEGRQLELNRAREQVQSSVNLEQ